jgi:hypothetical protein
MCCAVILNIQVIGTCVYWYFLLISSNYSVFLREGYLYCCQTKKWTICSVHFWLREMSQSQCESEVDYQ